LFTLPLIKGEIIIDIINKSHIILQLLIILHIFGITLATIQITIKIIHSLLNLQKRIHIIIPFIPAGISINLKGILLLLYYLLKNGLILTPSLDVPVFTLVEVHVEDAIEMDWDGLKLLRKGLFAQLFHVVADLGELGNCEAQLAMGQVFPSSEGEEAEELRFHGLEGSVEIGREHFYFGLVVVAYYLL
jgi:hypothetical protein